jgi:predicted protein tyrosine phosphatase
MFEIKVMGIHKAKTLIAQDWPTHIISVINDAGPNWPGTYIDRQHNNHGIYNFHDVEADDPEEYADLTPPSLKVMQEIIDEVKSWELTDESKVLVHCSAGKSRSTAIAMAILVLHGMSPADALQKVKLLSPAMCPNRLMTEYLDEVIGAEGELLKTVNDWYDKTIIMIPGLAFPNRGGYNR